MTNTEIWLDEITSHIKSVKSDIWMLHEIMSLPNCNDCKNKDCEYKPKWGEHIRYNCPLHADRKTDSDSEKPNNCDPQTDCESCKYFGHDEIEACGYCRHKDLYEPQTERKE